MNAQDFLQWFTDNPEAETSEIKEQLDSLGNTQHELLMVAFDAHELIRQANNI